MLSIASCSVQPGRATVASNGYRLTATTSISPIPCCASARRCSGASRRARMPACTAGCSVFTRPSRISGNPVTRATSVTAMPRSLRARAVPPVERIVNPNRGQRASEFDHSGLVGHADQRVASCHVQRLRPARAARPPARRSLNAAGGARTPLEGDPAAFRFRSYRLGQEAPLFGVELHSRP